MPVQCLIIAGMHRSGTSAVARTCNLLGVELGTDLMPAHEDNVAGYWEHAGVVDIHVRLLDVLGLPWFSGRPMKKGWHKKPEVQPLADELKTLIRREFSGVPLWGIKDPRICRFLPLWYEILDELDMEPRVLMPFRDPGETVGSLHKRDQIPVYQAAHMWQRQILDAERDSRGGMRAFLDYDDLMSDWRAAMARVWPQLGWQWTEPQDAVAAQIDEFLSPGLRHQRGGSVALPHGVDELYALLRRAQDGEDIKTDNDFSKAGRLLLRDPLTRILGEDPEFEAEYTPRFARQAFEDRTSLTNDLNETEARYKDLEANFIKANEGLDILNADVKSLNQRIAEGAEKQANLEREYEKATDGIKSLQKLIEESEQRYKDLEKVYLDTKSAMEDLSERHQDLNTRHTELTQLKAAVEREYEAAVRGIRDLQTNLAHAYAQAGAAQARLDRIDHSLTWKIATPLRWMEWIVIPHVGRAFRDPIYRRTLWREFKDAWRGAGFKGVANWMAGGKVQAVERREDEYTAWVREFNTFDDARREQLKQRVYALAEQPTISIIMPVYNPYPDWLNWAIDSVVRQIYPNWQLCIADDASPNEEVRDILRQWQERDSRIQVVFRSENGHISAASNSALGIAEGGYVALLDHDDELSPDALLRVAEAIAADPNARMFYSDEDKLDDAGKRYDPHFKSDWNPDLFMTQNYTSHLTVYEKALVDAVGGFREGFEGSQDYDLALRIIEKLDRTQIHHIPHILYHWRAVEGSTALAPGEKSFAVKASRQALVEHLDRSGIKADVEPAFEGSTFHRVVYPIPDPAPLASILIPTKDKVDLLKGCVESIAAKTTYAPYEIVVVDNNSEEDETFAYFAELEKRDNVRVVKYEKPFNFSAINNFAASHAKGEVLVMLNNDIEVIAPNWLRELVSQALRPEIGCVGGKLYYANDTIQHAGVITGLGGVAGHSHKHFPRNHPGYFYRLQLTQNLSAVTAACLAIRKTVFDEVEGLNETDLAVAFNDVDFCLRVRDAGYRNLWSPYVEMYHLESISRGYEDTPEKVERFGKEIEYMKGLYPESVLQYDPYYSPNLTLDREDFGIAFPPRAGD